MGKVVLYSTVSVDGFIADEHDRPGPLFDWLSSGDVPLDETGQLTVSQASYDYTRAYWDQIGVTIFGRHVFDLTDGWGGTPPSVIDHAVVVSHRPAPEGWRPEAPFHFIGREGGVSEQTIGSRATLAVVEEQRSHLACSWPASSLTVACSGRSFSARRASSIASRFPSAPPARAAESQLCGSVSRRSLGS